MEFHKGVLTLAGLLVLAVAPSVWGAQDVAIVNTPPDWVALDPLPSTQSEAEGSGGTEYLLLDEQVDITADRKEFTRIALRVLNQAGVEAQSTVSVDYDPAYERLIWHWIRVVRNGEMLNRLAPDRLQTLQREEGLEASIYDGAFTSLIVLEDIRPGDVIDYAFSVEGSNPVLGEPFSDGAQLAWSSDLLKRRYRLRYPSNRQLAWRRFGTDIEPRILNRPDGIRELTIEESGVEAVHADNNVPGSVTVYPRIQISESSSWRSVSARGRRMFSEVVRDTHRIEALASRFANNARNREESAIDALQWVQDEIRYFGMEMGESSHRPSSPSTVLDRRYGDCKDKSLLLRELLRTLGFRAELVLVDTRSGERLPDLLPARDLFDHAIVAVQHEGERVWLDPTVTMQGGTDFDSIVQPDYGWALVLDDTGELRSMGHPGLSGRRSYQHLFDFQGAYPEPVHLTVTTRYVGGEADWMRRQLAQASRSEMQRRYTEYFERVYDGIEVIETFVTRDDRDANELTTVESYLIRDFWRDDPERENAVTADFYPLELYDELPVVESLKRTTPLSWRHPYEVDHRIHARFTSEWPEDTAEHRVEAPAFVIETETRLAGKRLVMENQYRSRADTVPVSRLAELKAGIEQARENLSYGVWQIPRASASPVSWISTVDVNREMLLVTIVGLIIGSFVAGRMYRYDPRPDERSVHTDPAGLGGWLILPGIGLVLGTTAMALVVLMLPVMFSDVWQLLGTQNSALGGISGQVCALMIGVICSTVLPAYFALVLLYFKRRSAFPRCFVVVVLSWTVADGLIVAVAYSIPALSTDWANVPETFRYAVFTVIWASYMTGSKRVRSTFRERCANSRSTEDARDVVTNDPARGGRGTEGVVE